MDRIEARYASNSRSSFSRTAVSPGGRIWRSRTILLCNCSQFEERRARYVRPASGELSSRNSRIVMLIVKTFCDSASNTLLAVLKLLLVGSNLAIDLLASAQRGQRRDEHEPEKKTQGQAEHRPGAVGALADRWAFHMRLGHASSPIFSCRSPVLSG